MENMAHNVTDKISDVQARIAPQIDEARESLNQINEKTTSWIRQNPGTALLGALAVGFLIGKIAAR